MEIIAKIEQCGEIRDTEPVYKLPEKLRRLSFPQVKRVGNPS